MSHSPHGMTVRPRASARQDVPQACTDRLCHYQNAQWLRSGCEAGTSYVFTSGTVTVCPYLVFATLTLHLNLAAPQELVVGDPAAPDEPDTLF